MILKTRCFLPSFITDYMSYCGDLCCTAFSCMAAASVLCYASDEFRTHLERRGCGPLRGTVRHGTEGGNAKQENVPESG